METQITGDNSMSPELESILSTIPEGAKQEFVTEMKRDILKELAYDDFPSFCEYCFKDTEKRESNFIVLRDFHKEWCELLKTESRLNLFSPVDFAKTSIITIAYTIWRLGRDANTRIVLISATYSQATKYLSEIKDNILDNRFIKEVFPQLKPLPDKIYKNRPTKWAEDAITVQRSTSMKDFSIQALGVLGPLLGARTDLMIFDDVVTLQNSSSVRLRQKMIEWFDSTALTRLTKTAQCIFVGTAWFSCYCDADQPVITIDGTKKISEIQVGDYVFDDNWNKTKVIQVFKTPYDGEMYLIQPLYSPVPIKCTPNHKFMTQYGWIEARNLLTTNDYLLMTIDKTCLSNAEILDHQIGVANYEIKRNHNTRLTGISKRFTKQKLEEYLSRNFTYSKIGKLNDCSKSTVAHWMWLYGLSGKDSNQPTLTTKDYILDPLFWRVVGYWLAEGHIYDNSVCFTFHEKEVEYHNDISQFSLTYLKKDLVCKQMLGAKSIAIQFNSIQIVDFLKANFNLGSHNKEIPVWVERLPKTLLIELILGYWRGDGCFRVKGQHYCISSVSLKLLYAIQRCLLKLGIISNIFKYANKTNSKPGQLCIKSCGYIYELRFRGIDGNKLFGLDLAKMKEDQGTHGRIIGDILYNPISKIGTESYEGYIYDIQTEAGGYHIPNIYVHNSDLPHYLIDKTDWTTIKYSVLPEDKELGHRLASWPERYSEERLAGMRAHNEREFNRTMRNVAKTSDAYPFAAYVEGMLGDFKRDDTWKHIIGMDLSTKKRAGTTIIVVAYSLVSGRKVIVDVEYGAWKSSVKKAKLIQYYNKYLPDKIVVEANSLQDDLVDDYKELKGNEGKRLPVKGVITTSSMKEVALVNLEEEFEEGMWKIAFKNNPHFERLKKELELYPDYKTTDGVMALLFCSVMLGGRRNKSGNIRVSVITPDGKVAHSTDKHKYDFKDYRLFNRIMQRAGTDVKMPKNYPEIADWIKKYQKYDEVDMTRKPELVEDEDYRIVLNEMISFVKALRELR